MDGLSPTLILISDVKTELEKGFSVLSGVQKFIDRQTNTLLHKEVTKWKTSQISAGLYEPDKKILATQKIVLGLLTVGCTGAPVLERLRSLEFELIESSEDIIKDHVQKLPFLMLIPLMFFIFPAIFLILLGPLLMNFL